MDIIIILHHRTVVKIAGDKELGTQPRNNILDAKDFRIKSENSKKTTDILEEVQQWKLGFWETIPAAA